MSQTAPDTFQIERLSTDGQFEAVRVPWADLAATAGPRVPVFLTWEWVTTWCSHLEPGWEPWVLAARTGDGALAGVWPLMLVHHRYGPATIKRLAFIGSNYAYRTHLDMLACPGEEEAVAQAFLNHLRSASSAWDALDLEGLAEGSPLPAALATLGGRLVERESLECPYAPLPESWDAYEMQQLSANRRQQIRARRRHLVRDFPGQVIFQTVREPAELPAAMDALVMLHRKRWHGRGQASSFDVPSFLAFHRNMAAVGLEHGWLRLYLLMIGDRPIAAEYCYLYNGVLFDYQKGFDPDPALERYSPGQLVLAYAIQEAIESGAHELDMARGNYDYKFSWTRATRTDRHLILGRSPVGQLWLTGGGLVAEAMARSRQILPDATRQRINQALSGRRRSNVVSAPDGTGDV